MFDLIFQFLLSCGVTSLLAGSLWGHALREFAEGDALPERARIRGLTNAGQHVVYGVAIAAVAYTIGASAIAILPSPLDILGILASIGTFLVAGTIVVVQKGTPRRGRVARAYLLATAIIVGLALGLLWLAEALTKDLFAFSSP